ncbi:MAG: Na/Pi cotransporter family protein [Treponema sp.]|jgi:phosphate:Na+ symporter|nr:Na/Pi cotransporter family protein [Treponema sp.]
MFTILFGLAGGLCLFLYGMKVMSEGVQQAAGERMRQALEFMTRNRFVAVLTGIVVTALVQSSSAATVMLVSFVNAGLLTLTQSIGVIMGANIGTTTTAWLVSLIGSFDIAILALPALAAGFLMKSLKWKHQAWGEALMGFGFIFLGLMTLNNALEGAHLSADSFQFIGALKDRPVVSLLASVAVGTLATLLMHSSAAAIAIIITLATRAVIDYRMACAMILGANIGTTIDAIMASIGAKTAAKRTALVHVLFNVAGSLLALCLFTPLLDFVNLLVPGSPEGSGIGGHLAMFHSVFNIACTLVFIPFVKPFAALVTMLIREKPGERQERGTYTFNYAPGLTKAPEMAMLQAVKEIKDMAGLVSGMYASFREALAAMKEAPLNEEQAEALVAQFFDEERYADEMRETLGSFLIECSARRLNRKTEQNIALLLRIIEELENMTDDCYSVGLLIERSVKKKQIFKHKEMEALGPYVALVQSSIDFLQAHLGARLSEDEAKWAADLEEKIDKNRNRLRKLGRKRIEAGVNVKTELLFIDLVRRIEKLGDYCYSISKSLAALR